MSAQEHACVVGVGTTGWGNFPDTDATGLGVQALKAALDDAGLTIADIDGLVTSRIPSYGRFGDAVGLNPDFTVALPAEGRQSGVALNVAEDLVRSGRCRTVALVYGNNGRSQRVYYGGEGGDALDPWGFTSLGAIHAMLFRQHMHRYGTTQDQLAEVAITFRRHAALNPQAVMQKPITREDYHSSRYIVEPLHLFDYCLINDGAVCIIVSGQDRARDMRQPVVTILGTGESSQLTGMPLYPDDFFHASAQRCARQVYESSGVGQEDVDTLMIYDNFSPTVLFTLEGFGFCGPGESGEWIQDGRIGLGGQYPTNTSGGHLSDSYMQGWALNVEAVLQVRGQAGARQVEGCRTAQFMAVAPIISSIMYGGDA
jgi:acetyl-CoA acetyltransferase